MRRQFPCTPGYYYSCIAITAGHQALLNVLNVSLYIASQQTTLPNTTHTHTGIIL
jgi:hypothetical protein